MDVNKLAKQSGFLYARHLLDDDAGSYYEFVDKAWDDAYRQYDIEMESWDPGSGEPLPTFPVLGYPFFVRLPNSEDHSGIPFYPLSADEIGRILSKLPDE